MYYETRVHKVKDFNTVGDIASAILFRSVAEYEALRCGNFMFLSDSHIDDRIFSETAIVEVLPDGKYRQVESITIHTKTTLEDLESTFIESTTPPLLNMGYVSVQIDSVKEGAKARFTCGCCGNRFTGIISDQLKFDQDTGYGICDDCSQYYK